MLITDYKSKEFLSFQAWRKDSKTVAFKGIYVDLTDGNIKAALLLSQIIYWFLPDATGKPKPCVKRNGKYWICKNRSDWWDEIRINADQYDDAIRVLEHLGFVERRRMLFANKVTCAISLNVKYLFKKIREIVAMQAALRMDQNEDSEVEMAEAGLGEIDETEADETVETGLDEIVETGLFEPAEILIQRVKQRIATQKEKIHCESVDSLSVSYKGLLNIPEVKELTEFYYEVWILRMSHPYVPEGWYIDLEVGRKVSTAFLSLLMCLEAQGCEDPVKVVLETYLEARKSDPSLSISRFSKESSIYTNCLKELSEQKYDGHITSDTSIQ